MSGPLREDFFFDSHCTPFLFRENSWHGTDGMQHLTPSLCRNWTW